ncbi:hypothetical protein ON010_g9606 [Phytophthora cinnamomi]|nr:hypothetical protein ON010_g9606 [Phytophthora cinnamomi]
MQQQFKDVHLVIIDEFSMVSCGMLYWIDRRMREIWPSHSDELFGGRDVYFTGDAAQLDPVVPSSLSTPLVKIGKLDPEWFSALRRLRQKVPTQADTDLFNTRCLAMIDEPTWTDNAKHVAYKNVDVAATNEKSISSARSPIVNITSQHFVQQKRLAIKRDIPVGTVRALVKDAQQTNPDRDRVVTNKLKLCIGAPVTLTYNMAQSAGLCNGTNAVVYDFMLAYAMTVHKVQGLTYKLTGSPAKVKEFQREEDRVSNAVARTTQSAVPAVLNMKAIAIVHNRTIESL